MTAKKVVEVPKLRGVIIKADGSSEAVEVENSLYGLQQIVGGYIEMVHLRDGADLFCNEDGIRLGLPRNEYAQALVESHGQRPIIGHLLGDCLVLGETNAAGDSTDVPEWVFEYLTH